MSFFYLTAVKGDMLVHVLQTIIQERLQYLRAILKGDSNVYNEYMVEGSIYDNVGHFMLCVVSILGGSREFLQFFINAEVDLFQRRLASMTSYDIRSFAKKLIRNIKKHDQIPFHIVPLQILCQHLILKNLAQHLCSSHSSKCDTYQIKVNFRLCLPFIAKREVECHNGTALIPCCKWKQYLTQLFKTNLKRRLHNTDLNTVKSDPRIMELLQKIKLDYFPECSKEKSLLLNKNLDKVSRCFPPCMLNLHLSLRKRHRLSHLQRFHYSLFLKDIGMPIEEAINLWREEYRLSPNGASCCHNWEKDEKKYLYGIRHMYGLEGCRKNYMSVNCNRIQSIDNACTEGGCPFKTFDSKNMLALLKNPSEQLVSQIMYLQSNGQYTNSCLLYLKSFAKTVDCDYFSFTPVKYYAIASKSCLDLL